MRITKRKKLTLGQKQEILELWNNEYPQNIRYNDISELEAYLNKHEDPNHILLIDENNRIKGWLAIGFIIPGLKKVANHPFAPGIPTTDPIGYFSASLNQKYQLFGSYRSSMNGCTSSIHMGYFPISKQILSKKQTIIMYILD